MIVIGKVSKMAAALISVSSLVACFVLSGKVTDLRKELELARQDIPLDQPDDTTTINLYLKEHREVVARHASLTEAAPQPAQMRVRPHDVLYYEFLDGEPEYMSPGIIVRGPSSEREIDSSRAPVISNGQTLSLSEASKTAGFDLVARAWLHPGYALEEIRRIDGRDALQLLYTDGINSVSLFEQIQTSILISGTPLELEIRQKPHCRLDSYRQPNVLKSSPYCGIIGSVACRRTDYEV